MKIDWKERLEARERRHSDGEESGMVHLAVAFEVCAEAIREARRSAFMEAAKEAETHGPHSCAMAGRTAGECVAESIRTLAAKEGET